MKNKKIREINNKGISLITLVITIIVIIILAGIVIVSINKNNSILSANEAKFKSDVDSFQSELTMYHTNNYTKLSGQYEENKLQADINNVVYTGTGKDKIDVTGKTINDVITSINGSGHENDFNIIDGKLGYVGDNSKEKVWATECNLPVFDDKTNVSIITTQTLPIKKDANIVYEVTVRSNSGVNYISINSSNLTFMKKNELGNFEAITNAITISNTSEIQGTDKEKYVYLTIDTSSLTEDGEYKIKLNKDVVQNILGVKNEETMSNSFVIDSTAPIDPDILPNTTNWINQDVTVTITYPSDSVTNEYSYDGTNWLNYTIPLTISSNCTVYAQSKDSARNVSGTSTLSITNIDKQNPLDAVISSPTSLGAKVSFNTSIQDNESGINISNSKYIISTTSTLYGLNDSVWNSANTFTSSSQSIDAIVANSGNYYVQVLSVDNAGNKIVTVSNGVDVWADANKPNTTGLPGSTTVAVKWDSNNNESHIDLATAQSDTSWYNYTNKQWANIETTNNSNNAYWIWIPRYAYKIDHPHTATAEQIHIKFLIGNTNIPVDGSTLTSDYTVHPAFTFGGTELTGIWVAKYEASNAQQDSMTQDGYTGCLGGGNNTSLQVRVVPDVYSWRMINIGNAETVCMNMKNNDGSVNSSSSDTHQMKNIEWGVIAYLSQSKYGEEPWINPYGDFNNGSYKLKTGYSGESKDSGALVEGSSQLHKYNNLTYGVNASNTHNIYGIYDIAGGAFEKVAAYFNNGNDNISYYGGPYFNNDNKIKTENMKYYDIYEPSDEEMENGEYYGQGGINLWNSGKDESQNIIRKRLANGTYNKFERNKGDALWEISEGTSYLGTYTDNGDLSWLIDTVRNSTQGSQYVSCWNDDLILNGYAYNSWLLRGGSFDSGMYTGLFSLATIGGNAWMVQGFRPVLITK